ncbi:hypothetical protein AB833_07040 [Chromatiales bacterium (ex Bugula neritina AB1)]|nr:hypothetical protein AB833_07040 [Chromatiales bacterium (ex Bugula neritina AB1)]
MQTTLYGIKNCDTIKKARRYLDAIGVEYIFHDYRVDGVDAGLVGKWVKQHGWETVLNKRGTTWRKLDDSIKEATTEKNAAELLCEYPAMIKRPILVRGDDVTIGFSEKTYASIFDQLSAQ